MARKSVKGSTGTVDQSTAQSSARFESMLQGAAELAARIASWNAAAAAVRELTSRLAATGVVQWEALADMESELISRAEALRPDLVRRAAAAHRELQVLAQDRRFSARTYFDLSSALGELETLALPLPTEITGKQIPGESAAETLVRLLRADLAGSSPLRLASGA